jgi:hypothetical protein
LVYELSESAGVAERVDGGHAVVGNGEGHERHEDAVNGDSDSWAAIDHNWVKLAFRVGEHQSSPSDFLGPGRHGPRVGSGIHAKGDLGVEYGEETIEVPVAGCVEERVHNPSRGNQISLRRWGRTTNPSPSTARALAGGL